MFKDRLREARLRAGFTQSQLAVQVGVAKSTLNGYERGNSEPDMKKIEKIMSVLGVDANYLWQDEMKNINAPTEEQMNELSAHAAALPATLSEGLDDLSKRVSHSDASSIEAADLAARIQRLDAHGKRVVEAVLELELERCAESTPSGGSARTE